MGGERAPVNRANPLAARVRNAIAAAMAEPDTPPAVMARIDAALQRIEAAAARKAEAAEAIARRHGALRTRMAEAVAALDDLIAKGD